MPYYKDENSNLHFLENEGFENLLPPGLTRITDAEAEALRAPTLESLKQTKNAEINTARAKANTGTFDHANKKFSCDQLSRSDIDGVNGEIALTGALPQNFPGAWKAVDNTFLPIPDVAAWTAFYRSMVAAGAANFTHAQQLKAQLTAATTVEEVAVIVW